ncbi:hypothetical protein J1N35_042592 [Gossypium stocksii]|uniref:Enoyl reductase (ER) domain-containing protein n=1 Tax=Gossypium stocksii TaxID=47602 RepID=A0A9D3U5U8_9ROSI|nr:hypothetical protein J1N35_042592 [Gossypium stocksii]
MEALLCKRLGDPTSSSEPPIELTLNHPIPKLDSPTAEKHPLPFIPGSDYAGTVDAVGPSVTKFKVGDYVCAGSPIGSFATFIVQDQSRLFEVPKGCNLVAAAGLPVAFGTSHLALVLLVLGAVGGVGLAAIQIGKICGAIVIAVARGDKKVQLLKSLGVDHVVDLMNQDEFLESRNLKGVDVLYDPVGGNLAKETRKLLNWGAQIIVIGFASGEIPVIPANIILVKANLAFSAIKDRKAIGKVMIVFDDLGTVRSKL